MDWQEECGRGFRGRNVVVGGAAARRATAREIWGQWLKGSEAKKGA